MSDFDAVLERLLGEPSFAAALAADPDTALSGYRLDAGELELLRSQVSGDAGGGPAVVETRTNKSSTFGLFSAVADIGHSLSAEVPPPAHSGFGSAPHASSGFGAAPTTGLENAGQAFGAAEHIMPPQGYHPHIDANGDGHWDKATFLGTKNDGVEIFVDVNHDGHADFVGHDTNSDGLVDYADYDKNDDGIFEKRMYDDNGDGWLDRTEWNRDK